MEYYVFDELRFDIYFGRMSFGPKNPIVYNTSALTRVQFDSICNYYNDRNYNRVENGDVTFATINAMHFTDIDVVCLDDYNATHPAGSSLADITYIMSTSPYRHIASGYKIETDWEKYEKKMSKQFKTYWYDVHRDPYPSEKWKGMTPIDGMLKEVDRYDFPMMCCANGVRLGNLSFTEAPTEGFDHCTLRLIITLADGRTLTGDLTITPEDVPCIMMD